MLFLLSYMYIGTKDFNLRSLLYFSAEKEKILSSLEPTLSYGNFKNCDMVIEAVFEDINIKHAVIKEVEQVGVFIMYGNFDGPK